MRIDAGGKQCPIPVIMAKKELEAGEQDVEIIVDGPRLQAKLSATNSLSNSLTARPKWAHR